MRTQIAGPAEQHNKVMSTSPEQVHPASNASIESSLGRLEEGADHTGGTQTLLDVQVRRRLVKHVNIGELNAHNCDGETLKLPTRQGTDVAVQALAEI